MIYIPDAPHFSYLSVRKLEPLLVGILHQPGLRNCLLLLFRVHLERRDELHVASENQSSCHIPARHPIDMLAFNIVMICGTDGTRFLVDGHSMMKFFQSTICHASESNEYSKTDVGTDAMN